MARKAGDIATTAAQIEGLYSNKNKLKDADFRGIQHGLIAIGREKSGRAAVANGKQTHRTARAISRGGGLQA